MRFDSSGSSARTLLGIVAVAAVTFAITTAVFVSPAHAQLGNGRMQGKVTDPSGTPIVGVKVSAYNPEMTPSTLETTTSESGRWSLLGFNSSTWAFTFEMDGYTTQERGVSTRTLGRMPDMNVTLEPSTGDMGSIGGDSTTAAAFIEGNALFAADDYAGALAKWQEFAGENPSVYQIQISIGTAFRRMGQLDEAVRSYELVIAQDPAEPQALINLGETLIEKGEVALALPHFQKATESTPDDPAVFYNIGEIYFDTGRAAEAIDYYEQALTIDPEYLPAYQQKGYAYINTGNMAKAIESFEAYLTKAPEGSQEAAVVEQVLGALREVQ